MCPGIGVLGEFGSRPTSSSVVAASAKRQAWRESIILSRANGPVRNRTAYLRVAMPSFVADEMHEVGNYLVSRLVGYIDSNHPTIEGMKLFVREAAEAHELPLPDDLIESVIEIAYFKWKGALSTSGKLKNTEEGT